VNEYTSHDTMGTTPEKIQRSSLPPLAVADGNGTGETGRELAFFPRFPSGARLGGYILSSYPCSGGTWYTYIPLLVGEWSIARGRGGKWVELGMTRIHIIVRVQRFDWWTGIPAAAVVRANQNVAPLYCSTTTTTNDMTIKRESEGLPCM
jgi:hypothetical protein